MINSVEGNTKPDTHTHTQAALNKNWTVMRLKAGSQRLQCLTSTHFARTSFRFNQKSEKAVRLMISFSITMINKSPASCGGKLVVKFADPQEELK